MTAPIAKDQFTFSLGKMSYIDSTYDDASVAPPAEPKRGFGHWVARKMVALKDWHRKQAVLREMELMTDRELSDIGLNRSDLPRVFEPEFAADHARGRDYIAY